MKNVEQVVGAPVITGSLVTAKGRAKAVMGGAIAGAVGSAARVGAQMAAERSGAGASPLPTNAFSLGYLAVTAEDIVVVEGTQGMLGPKAKSVLVRVPRSCAQAAHWGGGALAKALTIEFTDGVTWELEVPRANVKHAEAVLAELHLNPSA